jgi:hypothetical protein
LPKFLSRDLRSFSSIPSISLDARTSFIIYLQPQRESMALAHSICRFPLIPVKPKFFEFIQNRKENIWNWKKPLCEVVPYVEVTLISKFHPIFRLVAQEPKLGRKYSFFLCKNCEQLWVDWTSLVLLPDKSGLAFLAQSLITVLSVIC